MKLIVLTRDIYARQWLGRLVNEAGLAGDDFEAKQYRQPKQAGTTKVEFVCSIQEAFAALRNTPKCLTIAWSNCLSAFEKIQLSRLFANTVLIRSESARLSCSTHADETISHKPASPKFDLEDCGFSQVVSDEELDVERLLSLLESSPESGIAIQK